ncbi:hypothetical protein MZM54_02575 [[Brevibacterium] frigoritolerans]|nr:hypothetical protein [Peribacillus frigoritolerans]
MNIKRLYIFAITHILSNILLASLCIFFMARSGEVYLKELVEYFLLLLIFGFIISVISNRTFKEFILSFVILTPVILPIMYAGIKEILSTWIIIFDAIGVWVIYEQLRLLEVKKKASIDESPL